MKTYRIDHISDAHNAGIAREHDLCHYFGIERTAHDSSDYRSNSDINLGDRHISVKASGFTLMSGNMCNGYDEFDDIWNLYKNTTHSNEFAYITEDYRVYEMNISEFEAFLRVFGRVEKEAQRTAVRRKSDAARKARIWQHGSNRRWRKPPPLIWRAGARLQHIKVRKCNMNKPDAKSLCNLTT